MTVGWGRVQGVVQGSRKEEGYSLGPQKLWQGVGGLGNLREEMA